ncbi:P-loop NTPase fold protein [Actinokineospora globicatena]|uniref:KAP NTPase domain-containing protein n=1 Tax=Actinokineospora globicatena TaxID=103729 RepID=A0A9W6QQK3_9PSEU|nr:P-loop NTPase fold protein [Actinokineospora globicatena]GLW94331.1 hypothetical protein Aglo03_51470 [Actinokineospora globicatena]
MRQVLGEIGDVTVTVHRTDQPWRLGADALVFSVGSGLGGLGSALVDRFDEVRSALRHVDLKLITTQTPRLIRVREVGSVTLLVVATPHSETRDVTLDSIAAATEASIEAAVRSDATFVAVPYLATGAAGLSLETVVVPVLAAVLSAVRSAEGTGLREIALFGRTEATIHESVRAWRSLGQPPSTSTTSSRRASDTATLTETAVVRVIDGTGEVSSPGAEGVPDGLAGGATTDLVDPTRPIPMERDRLGVSAYVSMVAAVITERSTETPLSIGVFGQWGAGKSFFMGLLRGRVAELAGGSDRYCDNVVQIGFNAWHYADTNLWASLADAIFTGLAGTGPDAAAQRAELRQELAVIDRRREVLEEANTRAEEEVVRLRAEVDRADADHAVGAKDVLAALRGSEVLKTRLDALWRKLGVDDQVEQGRLLSAQLQDIHADVAAVRELPRTRQGKVALFTAVVVMALGAVAALAVPLITMVGVAVAGVVALLGAGRIAGARKGLGDLRALAEDLRAGLAGTDDTTEVMDRLRKAEAEHEVATARLREVVARVGELGGQVVELDPQRRVSAFITSRAEGDTYTRGLGVVSTLRKDFERLVALLADWRADPRPGLPPVDRVVLYIDDLDRCGPRQVVQVLEAVHLLLAMDLFAVVIGVDPQWLLRAVRTHYAEVLGPEVTAENYLEKIVNIPFALPGMAQGNLGALLRSMADTEATVVPASAFVVARTSLTGGPVVEELTVEPGAELATATPVLPPRPLTDRELVLLGALDPLIATPRAAKRFLNTYRMVRATRDLADEATFLGDNGDYQAVIVLLGIVAAVPALIDDVFLSPPSTHGDGGLLCRDPGTQWGDFAKDLLPRDAVSPVAGDLNVDQVDHWVSLHDGLARASELVTLPTLERFHFWAPHIRRFSYA